jgi:hypothetical protein
MAFSFNPGQIAPPGGQAQAIPGAGTVPGVPGTVPAVVNATGVPSPFLFIQNKGQPMTVMTGVQIILIFASILSIFICGTLYAYSLYLQSAVSDKKALLDAKEAEFVDYPYSDMKRLSDRMASLHSLLDAYVSIRSPLRLLEHVVENQVVFDEFRLERDYLGAYSITFSAVTGNYRSLIQQLDDLNLKEYSKVAIALKAGELIDQQTSLKVQVTTPIMVKGKLPEEVVFLDLTGASTTISTAPVGSSTSQ